MTTTSRINWLKPLALACGLVAAGQAMAQITFYEGEGYRGRAFSTQGAVGDFTRYGFNDRASSVVVDRGRWEVCEDVGFRGRCVLLRRGSYDSLRSMGFNDRISSVRPARGNARWDEPAPVAAVPDYQWRRRPNERVYEVPVTSVRAVVGPPEQRCWVERQPVTQPAQPNASLGGAIIGGIVGGILGHQVGGGSGRDLATAAGAVGGAVVGNNIGRNQAGTVTSTRDVQRCENVQNQTPAYYDVTYNYRGMEHHVQMSAPPGRTIVVNASGEPRQ